MTRMTLAPGIRRDGSGIEARVKIGRTDCRYARFPFDTPLAEVQAWQRDERTRLGKLDRLDRPAHVGRPATTGGTLAAAAERFLPQIAGRASFKADRSHLRAWYAVRSHAGRPLGDVAVALLTTEDVNLAIAQWQTTPPKREARRIRVTAYARDPRAGTPPTAPRQVIKAYDRQTPVTSGQVVAAKTIRHRCRVLDELCRTLQMPSPVDGAKIPKVPKPHPIGVELAIVRQVAQALAGAAGQSPDHAKTYARFAVLVTTGQRPCQVMRTQPSDLDLAAGLWIVRSAKNEPAHTITLNDEMVSAWEAFLAAEAWGAYDTTLHANRVHAAGWPKGIRPYAARHAVMMDAMARGLPLDEVQGLAGHTSPLTTRQFYAPVQVSRQRRASDLLMGRMAGLFGPRLVKNGAVLPPPFTTPATGKGRKRGGNIGSSKKGG